MDSTDRVSGLGPILQMTMQTEREPYRKLPGHRRGILRGASLWLGSDHLLSVKSLRFREEYKRFYLRDVQAIVVARVPRFHLSTRSIGIACLWGILLVFGRNLPAWMLVALWSAFACLAVCWLYVCLADSCRCRIYTAVSSDELPSICWMSTARKFLAEVEPRIRQVQGVLEGDWAEALENRDVGPPGITRPIATPTPGSLSTVPPDSSELPSQCPEGRSRTVVSDIFVTSLFADALLNLATLHSLTRTIQWIWYALAFIQIGGAILIFVQRYRGILKAGMQKLAIATLIVMGSSYYLRQVVEGVDVTRASRPLIPDPALLTSMPAELLIRQVDAAICLALGIVGVVVALMGREDRAPRSIAS